MSPEGIFLPHIMSGAFSALSLSLSSPWLRLGRMYTQDIKLLVFIAQDGPHPSKFSKMLTFALGFPGGLCRKDPSRRHLGPIFGRPEASWWHLGGIFDPSSIVLRHLRGILVERLSINRFFTRLIS